MYLLVEGFQLAYWVAALLGDQVTSLLPVNCHILWIFRLNNPQKSNPKFSQAASSAMQMHQQVQCQQHLSGST